VGVLPDGGYRTDVRPGRLLPQIRRPRVSRTSARCERYVAESKRLLGVLETRLAGRTWIMGDDYTIADVAMLGWVRNLIGFYEARDLVDYDSLKHVPAWLERGLARPAVERGLNIPKRG
jgi:GST-like protein